MGSIGKRHIGIIKEQFPEILISVLRHQKCGEKFHMDGVEHCFSSIEDALAYRPEAAIIANPATYHLATAKPLARAGVHLLIEKPISITGDGLDSLISICNENNVVLMTGYNLRFLPSLKIFRKNLYDKKIGRIFSIRSEVGQYLPGWRLDSDYRDTVSAQKRLGGGVLLELSHEIDYLLWLFGSIDWVKAHISKQSNLEVDVEDTAHIILGFDKDESGYQLIASLNMDFIRQDTVRNCTVIGEKGSLKWNAITGTVEYFGVEENKWQIIFSESPERNYTYIEEVNHFFECIDKNEKPLISGVEGKATVDVIEAVKCSSMIEKSVYLNHMTGNN